MYTLCLLIMVWFIISCIRINNVCKKTNCDFNPFNGTFIDWAGFVLGGTITLIFIVTMSLIYLP